MERVIRARPLVPGRALGQLLVSSEPLSFWGGYDANTGEIIDRRHPLAGQMAAGRVLVLPFARGSSTTTAVLLEAVRLGQAPAAILTTGADTFFALAAIVAEELYGHTLPVLAIHPDDLTTLGHQGQAQIYEDGTIEITVRGAA